ncbi:hypothetical protein ACFVR6_03785 [Microbacterium sp. NPDC058021]|uniref:hypothetical protein n=1 Tax=Microbacterium sp. NPDC058021 TaxID=3346306 RepID=UPI0036DF5F4B
MSTALFELEDFEETRTEWEPIYCRWDQPQLVRLVNADVICRDCGRKAGYNQGGADRTGSFMVCDDCASLDRCLTRQHDRGPGWHVSHWGESHRADEHDALVAKQAKRRAAYLARAAVAA